MKRVAWFVLLLTIGCQEPRPQIKSTTVADTGSGNMSGLRLLILDSEYDPYMEDCPWGGCYDKQLADGLNRMQQDPEIEVVKVNTIYNSAEKLVALEVWYRKKEKQISSADSSTAQDSIN